MTSKGSPILTTGKVSSATNYNNSSLKRPDIYRSWLEKRFKEFDAQYYRILDELEVKIDKLNDYFALSSHIVLPDMEINEFDPVEDWMMGKIPSSKVSEFFNAMNIDDVANKRITRRLSTLMADRPECADLVRSALKELHTAALPIYIKFLNMEKKYFEVLARIDKEQIPLTWIEQTLPEKENVEVQNDIQEIPLNQFVNAFDTFILKYVEDSYYLDENTVCFNEDNPRGRWVHWIMGPKSYIDILKQLYNIKEKMDNGDRQYLKRMIKGFLT